MAYRMEEQNEKGHATDIPESSLLEDVCAALVSLLRQWAYEAMQYLVEAVPNHTGPSRLAV
jgi:hypothetical protein